MKNKILGFVLLLAACAIAYAVVKWGPLGINVKTADCLRGFTVGFGLIIGAALVALLLKNVREKGNPV